MESIATKIFLAHWNIYITFRYEICLLSIVLFLKLY